MLVSGVVVLDVTDGVLGEVVHGAKVNASFWWGVGVPVPVTFQLGRRMGSVISARGHKIGTSVSRLILARSEPPGRVVTPAPLTSLPEL